MDEGKISKLAMEYGLKCDPLNQTLEKQADIRQGFIEGMKQALILCGVSTPVRIIAPIKITWFNNIEDLNKWYGDGSNCEIIAMNYDDSEGLHYVHYRLK